MLHPQYKPNRRRNKHYKLQEIEKLSRTRSMELMEKLNKAAHQMRKSIAYGLESLADFEENQDELSDEVKVARSAKADEGTEKSGGSSVKSVEALKPPPKSRVQPIKVPPKPTKSDAALVKPDVNEIVSTNRFLENAWFPLVKYILKMCPISSYTFAKPRIFKKNTRHPTRREKSSNSSRSASSRAAPSSASARRWSTARSSPRRPSSVCRFRASG